MLRIEIMTEITEILESPSTLTVENLEKLKILKANPGISLQEENLKNVLIFLKNGMSKEDVIDFLGLLSLERVPKEKEERFQYLLKKSQEALEAEMLIDQRAQEAANDGIFEH